MCFGDLVPPSPEVWKLAHEAKMKKMEARGPLHVFVSKELVQDINCIMGSDLIEILITAILDETRSSTVDCEKYNPWKLVIQSDLPPYNDTLKKCQIVLQLMGREVTIKEVKKDEATRQEYR